MKKIVKSLAITVLILALGSSVFAQTSATATTTATILSALSITNTTPLDFGTIVTGTAGTVTISTAGARSSTGPVLHASNLGQAATFEVDGSANLTYSIAITPASLTITHTTLPANTMTVDNFQSSPAVAAGGQLDGTGQETIAVGGDLDVGTNQEPGTYENAADLTVTINYN